jgi:hypothetical protein
MDFLVLLSALVVVGLVLVIYHLWSKWPLNIVGLFCLSVGWFYGFHMVAVAFGLDTLFPDYLFTGTRSSVVVRANVLLALFLTAVIPGLIIGRAAGGRAGLIFPAIDRRPTARAYRRLASVLTLGSVALVLALLVRYGSFGDVIRAAKVEKDLAGTFFLHIIPDMGVVVSTAWFLDVLRRRGRRFTSGQRAEAWISATFALLNGVCVLAWGSRTLIAIAVFTMLAGWSVFGRRQERSGPATRRRGTFPRILLAGLIVTAAVVGLRVGRDHVVIGEVSPGIADQQLVRQVAVGGNMTQYDAFVLAVRDWPRLYDYRGGEDFVVGAQGVVPRAVWPDKPTTVAPGSWFRRVYEPTRKNGWPPGTAGEWYLNLGPVGLAIGGLLSGVLIGLASRALRQVRTNPFAFAASIAIGMQVLLIGFQAQLPVRWVQWCLPLILVTRWLGAGRARSHLASTQVPGAAVRVGTRSS